MKDKFNEQMPIMKKLVTPTQKEMQLNGIIQYNKRSKIQVPLPSEAKKN